jgi:hypothetical protein
MSQLRLTVPFDDTDMFSSRQNQDLTMHPSYLCGRLIGKNLTLPADNYTHVLSGSYDTPVKLTVPFHHSSPVKGRRMIRTCSLESLIRL